MSLVKRAQTTGILFCWQKHGGKQTTKKIVSADVGVLVLVVVLVVELVGTRVRACEGGVERRARGGGGGGGI
jgi:hypothetical protein